MSEIPKVTMTFGNLAVNGKPVKLSGVQAIYPENVPDYANAAFKEAPVVIEVGKPVQNRTDRQIGLLSPGGR